MHQSNVIGYKKARLMIGVAIIIGNTIRAIRHFCS